MASFEALQALAEVVAKNKVKHIQVIGNPDSKSTKFEAFYEALASGQVQSDEAAAQCFYQSAPDHAAYRKLKTRLQERLVNTLFFVDVNQQNFNDHNRAYFTCCKQVAATKILIGLNARQAAIPIAEEALKLALEFEFVEFIVSLARDLQIHYGTITGDRKKFEQASELVKKYTEVLNAEILAQKYYADIMSYFVTSKATKPEIKDKVSKYAEEMEALLDSVSSPRFNFYAYLILTLRYEVKNDYINTIKICNSALEYFEPIADKVSISNIFSFSIKMLGYQVYLGNFKAGERTIGKCLKFSREGTFNWFMTLEYAVILAFHSRKFQDAYTLYNKAARNSNFDKQPTGIRERWFILEAYIFFFRLTKKLQIEDTDSLKKFRLTRFLNDVPVYSKDKRGANISILVLQILFLLQQQKYGEIIDRTESLKTYMQRYLRQDDTYRSNCFIHMLLTLPDCSFHKKAVLRKAEKYWNKLLEVPMSAANQNAEIEIVPYEMLWEFVLESLDEKWH